jgi:hypothetical protein
MKIDEREIDRLSTELIKNQYTGLFQGPTGPPADFKTCLQDYLQKTSKAGSPSDVFPLQVSHYLDGNHKTNNSTLCIFNIDYDLISGLSISASSVLRKSDLTEKILTASHQLKTLPDLPSKKEVMNLEFRSISEPVLGNKLINQVEELQHNLSRKGYDSNYYDSRNNTGDVKSIILNHLAIRQADNQQEYAFPVWVGTITAGELADKVKTICKLRIQYDEQKGFDVDCYIHARMLSWNTRMLAAVEHKISSIKEMPTKIQLNNMVSQIIKAQKKNRLKF